MVSNLAVRKLRAWLDYCLSIGWPRSALSRLTDLWWEFHDEETGDLKPADGGTEHG